MKTVMKKVMSSTPALALLVVAAGVGVAYAANGGDKGGEQRGRGEHDQVVAGFAAGPPGSAVYERADLSDEERSSLEAFGECMQKTAPRPDGEQPTDPAKGKEAFDAAFEACKSKLTDEQAEQFEEGRAQEEKFTACMEENGAPKPTALPAPPPPPPPAARGKDHVMVLPAPEPLSKADTEALKKADEACAELRPEGPPGPAVDIMVGPGPGGPGPQGHGGPGVMVGPHPGPPPTAGDSPERGEKG